MVKSYRQLPIDTEVHERLATMRSRVSELITYKQETIGMGSMVGILMDHFAAAPPTEEWLRARVAEVPHRGRPKRSAPVIRINEWGSPVVVPPNRFPTSGPRKHYWVVPKARPHIAVCLHCSQPSVAEYLSNCAGINHPATASLLKAASFTDEEIAALGFTER